MGCVSVVVPTFNRAHMIGRALESIFQQSYPDIEIVVVDDGSTDETPDVVKELAAGGRRPIRYHWQENNGCAAARNRGIDLATGRFITFLDSDDTWRVDAIESMVTALNGSGADFVYSPAIEVLEDGSEYLNYPVAAGQPERFAQAHFMSCNVRNGAVLFRRRVVEAAGGFNETLRFNEDSDLLQRVAIDHRAAYVGTPTLRTVHHDGSKSRNAVGLHQALVVSAEQILQDNARFAETLGDAGRARVSELKALFIEALIAARRADEAAGLTSSMGIRPTVPMRLALHIGSTAPIRYTRRGRQLAARFRLRRGRRTATGADGSTVLGP